MNIGVQSTTLADDFLVKLTRGLDSVHLQSRKGDKSQTTNEKVEQS